MRSLFVFVTLFLLSQASAWGQVVVGTYHLAATDKDYVVLIDDMQNRYEGDAVNDQLKKCQILLQVESNDDDIESYLKIPKWYADNFGKALSEKFIAAEKYAQKKSVFRKKAGDDDNDLFMKRHDNITGNDIYGYESNHDYDIYYERNESGQLFLCYNGEAAKSEGHDGLTISGWRLVITSIEEAQKIDELLVKAKAMIKSNSLNPEL